MRSTTAVIKLRWHATAGGGGHVRSAAGLLRYISERDQHPNLGNLDEVDGLTRYVAWRDQAAVEARLFDQEGALGEADRRPLAEYIERSVAGMEGSPGWRVEQNRKSFYHLIISPEDAHGLDLRRATRAVMAQLARDAGTGGLPPWIAAEHRNSRHPHVHVVLAARRQRESGAFRRLDIPHQRLDRLHLALADDLAAQRDVRAHLRGSALRAVESVSRSPLRSQDSPSVTARTANGAYRRGIVESLAWSEGAARDPGLGREVVANPTARVGRIVGRLARHYAREAEREAARRREDPARDDRGRGE